MEKRFLVLGDGLLGTEIVKQTGWDYISRKKDMFDVSTNVAFEPFMRNYTDIINCIAHTKTRDNTKPLHHRLNVVFPKQLSEYCSEFNKKLIHISTDYVYAQSVEFAKETDILVPTHNWYGYSKMLGDNIVRLLADKHLIIRTTFKPNPYPYEYAWNNLVGNFDYVDVISKMIIDLINQDARGVFNVGTEVKNLYDLAKRTNPNVKVDYLEDTTDRPKNTTMNLDKLNNFVKGKL